MSALAGCSASGPPDQTIAPMWQSRIDQVLANPQASQFERRVLSDYVVTDAEYQEARTLYKQCMTDQGWDVTDAADNGYNIQSAPGSGHEGDDPHPDSDTCSIGTTENIEPIYMGMRENPQGLTTAQQIRNCYTAHGVPDGVGLSDDQFAAMVSTPHYHASTPEGKLCFWDPTGSQGLTVEQAEELDANSEVGTPVEGPSSEPTG